MRRWNSSGARPFLRLAHRAHAGEGGTNLRRVDGRQLWLALADELSEPTGPEIRAQSTGDKAAPALLVMLHLRSCYVSKAAILTIPVHSVPVENRSPA
jgi:hypothetical protein